MLDANGGRLTYSYDANDRLESMVRVLSETCNF